MLHALTAAHIMLTGLQVFRESFTPHLFVAAVTHCLLKKARWLIVAIRPSD